MKIAKDFERETGMWGEGGSWH